MRIRKEKGKRKKKEKKKKKKEKKNSNGRKKKKIILIRKLREKITRIMKKERWISEKRGERTKDF